MKKLFLLFGLVVLNYSNINCQWHLQNPLPQMNTLMSVDFVNIDIGWAVGFDGTVIKTTDSGITWTSQISGTSGNLFDVTLINENTGTAVGGYFYNGNYESIILRTTNGGIDWVSQLSVTGWPLSGVSFTDTNNGTVVGDWGTILRTTNGGETWIHQDVISSNLYGVCVTDSANGTAVGGFPQTPPFDPYTIIRTTDAGVTWTKYFYNDVLRDIFFIDSNNGIIVGEDGIILKTTNNGIYWSTQSSGTTNDLFDMSFPDVNNGWIVGDNGAILKTTNGGETWDLQTSGTINSLFGVSFSDSNNGWAVGSYGTIIHTTNGGVTFIEDENNFTQPKDFLLQQNSPNPFNPSTKISWQSPVGSWQTLKVYDVLGNEIATLVDEFKPAGSYEVEFQSSVGSIQLASGMYFYRLKAGDYIQTKKMLLLK